MVSLSRDILESIAESCQQIDMARCKRRPGKVQLCKRGGEMGLQQMIKEPPLAYRRMPQDVPDQG